MMKLEDIINNSSHWQNKKPPLSPNEYEVRMYKKLIGGYKPVYLLGMTAELMDLCDVAVDLNPIETDKKIMKKNWLELEGFHAGAIIGDGALNLTSFELINKLSLITDKLILRVFLARQEWMKYADFFPTSFPGAKVFETQKDIAIVYWDFEK